MNNLCRRARRQKISLRNRRKRRSEKAFLKHGHTAKPTHKLQAGRTGSVHKKKTPPKPPKPTLDELIVLFVDRLLPS